MKDLPRLGRLGAWLDGPVALATFAVLAALVADGPPGSAPPPQRTITFPEGPRCSVARGAAATRARALELDAEAQRARYPFAPQVGLTAWSAWSEAAACQRLAGDAPAALRTEALAGAWQRRLEHDLRATQLRLERALATSEPAAAAHHARRLLALLPAANDGYRRWLLRIRAAGAEARP